MEGKNRERERERESKSVQEGHFNNGMTKKKTRDLKFI